MKLVENMLFKYGNGKVIRILFINPVTSIIYIIDMDSSRWPYPVTRADFLILHKNREIIVVEEDIYSRAVPEEELNNIEKMKRDHSWEIVSFFKSNLVNEEHMYISKFRQTAIKKTMETFNISYNGLKKYLIKYLKGGKIKSGLLPNYFRCGARGKERKVGEKKRGRPRQKNENVGVNIDDNIKKFFKVGLNRYYYNHRKNSLKTTYELILRDYFTTETVEESGVRIPILVEMKKLPTYEQFLYWFRKTNNSTKQIISRNGTRVYQQNYRAIIGNSTQDAGTGPGTLFQIDSTMFDIYLVSSFNRDLIVGRPILFLVVDIYSRVILGFNIGFESLNSYSGAMVALANSMTSKVGLCRKYGMDITDEEFPFCVPQRILTDRGELVSSQIENAIENLGITIQQTPPYHADFKGIIESSFNILNLKVKPFADGVVVNGNKKGKERGEYDYRLKGTLSLDEFTKIVIKCILFHNNHHVLNEYVLDETMIEKKVEKIPIKIWEHGLKYKKGQLRILPEKVIKTHLFPTDYATLTARGLSYRKLLFASEYALKNGWFQKARIEGSKKVKICYNPMDLSELLMFDENGELHKFSLLEHLSMYSNKGVNEIEQLKKHEQEIDSKNKEKELQEKIKLYSEIENIVKEARERTEAEKDHSKSKSQRIKGIKENQRNERMLQRKKAKEESVFKEFSDELNDEIDEFAMFREWGESDYDE
ncbi:integrase-like protein [Aneurinibacillus soli]|uniref:Transposon Tn7 transposition protein TnsB n=1 Tax=Aneurinibacillus soli TaxID=1500254 RepID=A0A0U5BFG4_9BACL|nr:DDE-type integrase/transposase/recombinase [Aneurinibacillus soli]PYE61908.1 integrase-like protein [Aneurinibacillus soli]BAU29724.1 Transposon Tn7 transposition protein TnsB [Aneurinibacillus soli]